MATLTEFIGEIVDSISKARFYADQGSAALSEQYFADPFIRTLPVPHYTIDDVEVKVPVMVVGIKTNTLEYDACKAELIEASTKKLPLLLLRNLRYNYFQEKDAELKKDNTPNLNDSDTAFDDLSPNATNSSDKVKNSSEIPKAIQNFFVNLSESISAQLIIFLKKYLNGYNYQVLKLLDLTEALSKEISRQLTSNLHRFPIDVRPQDEAAYTNRSAKFIGNVMFFEYKKILQTNCSVEIDPNTAKMNEFTSQVDCLMHITLKVREQDLNLLVENTDGKEKRFLSLT